MVSLPVGEVYKLRFWFQLEEALNSVPRHLPLHQKPGNKLSSEISQPREPQMHVCRCVYNDTRCVPRSYNLSKPATHMTSFQPYTVLCRKIILILI